MSTNQWISQCSFSFIGSKKQQHSVFFLPRHQSPNRFLPILKATFTFSKSPFLHHHIQFYHLPPQNRILSFHSIKFCLYSTHHLTNQSKQNFHKSKLWIHSVKPSTAQQINFLNSNNLIMLLKHSNIINYFQHTFGSPKSLTKQISNFPFQCQFWFPAI